MPEKRKLKPVSKSSVLAPVEKIKTIPETIYQANIVNQGKKHPYITGMGVHNGITVIFTVLLADIAIPYTINEDGSVTFRQEARA